VEKTSLSTVARVDVGSIHGFLFSIQQTCRKMMCIDASIAFILAYKVKPDDVQTRHGWGNAKTGNMNLIMGQSSSFVGKSILAVSGVHGETVDKEVV
jgi:hypothetical protein